MRDTDLARRLDLRGSGEDSFFLAFSDYDYTDNRIVKGKGRKPESDTLQIYDIDDGKLGEPKFTYQPTEPDYTFVRGAADLNGDLTKEIVGGWVPASKDDETRAARGAFRQLPVVISSREDEAEDRSELRGERRRPTSRRRCSPRHRSSLRPRTLALEGIERADCTSTLSPSMPKASGR